MLENLSGFTFLSGNCQFDVVVPVGVAAQTKGVVEEDPYQQSNRHAEETC